MKYNYFLSLYLTLQTEFKYIH